MADGVELLYTRLRSDLCDPAGDIPDEDRLWSDAEVYDYLDDAQLQVAKDLKWAIHDTYLLTLVVDQAEYTLPKWIIRVRRAKRMSDAGELDIVNNDDRDTHESDRDDYGTLRERILYEDATGTPTLLTLDEKFNTLRLVPIPTVVDTLKLYVYRGPKVRIEGDGSPLELNDRSYERALLLWMKKRAYEKHDAETIEGGRSDKFFAEYNAEIARLYPEIKQRHRRSGTVRYGGL